MRRVLQGMLRAMKGDARNLTHSLALLAINVPILWSDKIPIFYKIERNDI